MSYLVLARKWRPKRFSELVGQEHVVRALSHALDSGRVHHAFLFTGTRGVGKTTIARIFAKSLNCEVGVGAEPCGECAICTAVDGGRFVDLIEIDAASNTGVDDVREVIENAQYLPTRGRYKVYLVDEVHMLSRNAFNALLKTLEEPPEHVKFLLATTDPQKLPVTVLSRCLQFNLKRLTPEQIDAQMRHILQAEQVEFDERSIRLLARGADGSLRDGLSLLDQAIAYGSGTLVGDDVAQMLGSVEHGDVDALLAALVAEDGVALCQAIEHLAGFAADFSAVLDALASALHRAQLRQLVKGIEASEDAESIIAASALAPELIALWYQMAVSGRRELPWAPSPRVGFEMILLRMLAFAVDGSSGGGERASASTPGSGRAAAAAAIASLQPAAEGRANIAPRAAPPAQMQAVPGVPAPALVTPSAPPASTPVADLPQPGSVRVAEQVVAAPIKVSMPAATATAATERGRRDLISDTEDWLERVGRLGLRGPASQLAAHAQYVSDNGAVLTLALPEVHEHLKMSGLVEQLSKALAEQLGEAPRIEFGAARGQAETLHHRDQRNRDERQLAAEAAFAADPVVQHLVKEHGARLVPDSVRPL